MAREILFRAKRIDDGEWIEGCVLRDGLTGKYYFKNKNDCLDDNLYEVEGNNEDGFLQFKAYEVDPETVCQYTGLTDKSGRKYEGDIFQASDGDYIQRYIIVWDEDSLEWSAQCIGDPDGTLPLSEFRVSEIEVIGNIFDNPELIGEQP